MKQDPPPPPANFGCSKATNEPSRVLESLIHWWNRHGLIGL